MSGKKHAAAKSPDQRLPATTESAPPRGLATIDPAAAVSPAMAPKWLTPQSMEAALNLADMMAKAKLVPEHLRGSPGDCLLVVSQAARWGIDPFAVAQATAIVRGKLCYEGKLVATVLRATGAIDGRLDYVFEGAVGPGMSVTVTGTPRGGTPKSLRGTVAQWRTDNGNWDKDPQSMLVYRGTRQWARLFAPEAMLGVITPDEIEEIKDAVVLGGSPGVQPTVNAPPAVVNTPPPAVNAPGQQVSAEVSTDADLTSVYQQLKAATGAPVAEKVWKRWAAKEQKAERLTAMRRMLAAYTTIQKRPGDIGRTDRLLADLTYDRSDPDNVDGMIADLEKAACAPPTPAPPAAVAKQHDDQPPH